LADVVAGRAEPSGRLPITFPARLDDAPTHGDNPGSYPGADGRVEYGEGIFVGYRHYDRAGIEPAFCFGHGLGYTTFELGPPEVSVEGASVRVAVPVTNTGERAGSEVVQVYVRDTEASVERPEQELAGFAKVVVPPGATETVTVTLDERVFSFWDEGAAAWRLEPGTFELRVGTSSRAIHHTTTVDVG
jgi:beta-glucosidase